MFQENVLPIRPRYGNAFRCIGAACEDTCCQHWGIPLDKKSYDKYQLFPPGRLADIASQYVVLSPAPAPDNLYGKINLEPSGCCPFLSQEKLCDIQSEYGTQLLSPTCSIYPRALNRVDGELEISLSLSCPEAARNILLHRDSTLLECEVEEDPAGPVQSSRLASSATSSLHKPYAFFHDVRSLLVAIMHERGQPLWKRVFLIGVLSKRLDAIRTVEQDNQVAAIL